MTTYGYICILVLLLTALLALGILRRSNEKKPDKKIGCIGFGFLLAVLMPLTVAIPFVYLIPATFAPLFTGEKRNVTIVGQSSFLSTSEDSDGREYTVRKFTPEVDIILEDGRTKKRELEYSSEKEAAIGSSITIFYDAENDTILSFDVTHLVLKAIGFTLCLWVVCILWIAVNYAIGLSIELPTKVVFNALFYVLIPMAILSFSGALMSYFYDTWILGNNPDNHPEGIALLSIIFIFAPLSVIYLLVKGLIDKSDKKSMKARLENKVASW